MILKECPPVLRGHFVSADHVFADAALTDVEAKFALELPSQRRNLFLGYVCCASAGAVASQERGAREWALLDR